MHIHDATEEAYKNGYEAGIKKFAERAKEGLIGYKTDPTEEEVEYVIDNLVKELIEQR